LILAFGAGSYLHAEELDKRGAAIERALAFLHRAASNDANLEEYGADLLWCFYSVSHTAQDRKLRETSAQMGRELAMRWRKTYQHVPANATAHEIYLLVSGAYAADRLGLPDRQFKKELRQAALRFSAQDYMGFDPLSGPPTPDDHERYDKWSGALITTYFGDAFGVRLGARYRDVVKLRPFFRPYQGDDEDLSFDSFYATTHLIYTLNGYHEHRVAPLLLSEEFAFLRKELDVAIEDEDPEQVGEALDCLKAGGFDKDPQVRKGMDYLISSQRPDGAWAGDDDDLYTQYHSAWTGIDGLRDYHFHGKVKKLPGNNH
jgi:hypothetical protein